MENGSGDVVLKLSFLGIVERDSAFQFCDELTTSQGDVCDTQLRLARQHLRARRSVQHG